jgi:hypothetical protein
LLICTVPKPELAACHCTSNFRAMHQLARAVNKQLTVQHSFQTSCPHPHQTLSNQMHFQHQISNHMLHGKHMGPHPHPGKRRHVFQPRCSRSYTARPAHRASTKSLSQTPTLEREALSAPVQQMICCTASTPCKHRDPHPKPNPQKESTFSASAAHYMLHR